MAPQVAAGLGFAWHPQARLFDAAGQAVARGVPLSGVIADRPAGAALAALGAPAFRIGCEGPAPEAGLQPVFETLTGGSSGAPRRIRRSQASWIASFAVNARLFGIGPACRVAILGQLIHSLALYGAVEALHLGAELHLLEGLRPDRQCDALAQRRVSLLYATPAQLRLLVAAGGAPLLDLRVVLVGGSKLDPALRKAMAQMAPLCAVHEFYGAAEASFITLAGPETPEESVGAPYPDVDLRVIDGEVWGRGAVDMLNLTASMAVAFRHLARSGFRPRGDLIYFAVADEESGSAHGMQWMADHERDAIWADYVLTENGGLHSGPKEQPYIGVNVGEKGVAWRTLRVHGIPGHGSQPFKADNALMTAAAVMPSRRAPACARWACACASRGRRPRRWPRWRRWPTCVCCSCPARLTRTPWPAAKLIWRLAFCRPSKPVCTNNACSPTHTFAWCVKTTRASKKVCRSTSFRRQAMW